MTDLRRKLNSLSGGFITTIIVDSPLYLQTSIDVLKMLVDERKLSGVYVTVNRPYSNIETMLQTNEVDLSKLFFIDAVTNMAVQASNRTENCLYVASPESLTDISIALDQVIHEEPQKNFIFFDSLSALLIYNNIDTTSRYLHMLTVKMRILKVQIILISLEKETDEKLKSRLTQFSDNLITVENGGE